MLANSSSNATGDGYSMTETMWEPSECEFNAEQSSDDAKLHHVWAMRSAIEESRK